MPENVIRVMCPNLRCRSILAVPSDARGRLVRCKTCGTNIKIPQKAETKADAAPPDAKDAKKSAA
ncbi:MAG: hypothetical protein JNK58_01770 [Phycisphaerae bacterium]|nr:hypothetical protein [Phycisphaerae bacterium]